MFATKLVWALSQCQAKFITSAKFSAYCCLYVYQ